MRKILSVPQMVTLEKEIYQDFAMSEELIIENVGRDIADFIVCSSHIPCDLPIVGFFGKGNNGADTLSALRHLYQLGRKVYGYQIYPLHESGQQLQKNFQQAKQYGVSILNSLSEIRFPFIALDGLLGTGCHLPLSLELSEVISFINRNANYTLSIDIPSGVVGDSGEGENSIMANMTLAIGCYKWGHFLRQGSTFSGKLGSICGGFPKSCLRDLKEDSRLSLWNLRQWMKRRDIFAHKQKNGHVLAIGGSKGLMGAIQLCSYAAMRTGVGLVTAQTTKDSYSELLNVMAPEVMKGVFAYGDLSTYQSIVVGPGFGRGEEKGKIVSHLMKKAKVPLLLDADAINQLNYKRDLLLFKERAYPTILTPHIGEMARFLGIAKADLEKYSPQDLKEMAHQLNSIIVLKSWQTFIIFPNYRLWVVRIPNDGLAKAGSGDVLSGILGGILASRLIDLPLDEIIGLGVLLHSFSAKLARKKYGGHSMMATHLIESLTHVLVY